MGPNVSKVLFNRLKGCCSVNFPRVSGLRTQEHHRFCLSTYDDIGVCYFPKSRRSDGPDLAKALFNHSEGCRSVKFPKVSGLRTQERLRFCLSTYEDTGVC